jgi:hypothetical protein
MAAAGPTGSLAVITSNGAAEGFRAITAKDFRWEVVARIAVLAGFYRPVRKCTGAAMPRVDSNMREGFSGASWGCGGGRPNKWGTGPKCAATQSNISTHTSARIPNVA